MRSTPRFVEAVGIENIRFRVESGNYGESRETALPTGKIERESTQGRADVGDVPTAETLGFPRTTDWKSCEGTSTITRKKR